MDANPNDADTRFALLDGSLQPAEAQAQMGSIPYGVVVDENGAPCALVLGAHLQSAAERGVASLLDADAGLPPTVLMRRHMDLAALADSGAMTAFAAGAAGAVVLADDQDEVLGVLPSAQIEAYLGAGGPVAFGIEMGSSSAIAGAIGDTALAGAIGTAVPAIIVLCATCGHRNELDFLDRDRPPMCQFSDSDVPEHRLRVPSQ